MIWRRWLAYFPCMFACLAHAAEPVVMEGCHLDRIAAEPDLVKPVTLSWDERGRLWVLDTPGRVLVFDQPLTPGPRKPRVFAEGFPDSTGLFPLHDGLLLRHATHIIRLSDRDGDGMADKPEVVLSGFDDRLANGYPHAFSRAPGDWLYLSQGAGRESHVRTTDGVVVGYNGRRLARFRPDGSAFEVVSAGPCHLRGLLINAHGESLIVNLGSAGLELVSLEHGAYYSGCNNAPLHSGAPPRWPLLTIPMAAANPGHAILVEGHRFAGIAPPMLILARPDASEVLAVPLKRDAGRYQAGAPVMLVRWPDASFTPVAVAVGPDGHLYIADRGGRDVSSNARGRLWRLRCGDVAMFVPDLAGVDEAALLTHLQRVNDWEWRAALDQIRDRPATGLGPTLVQWLDHPPVEPGIADPVALQLRALWALEHLGTVQPLMLAPLIRHSNPNLRREAVRVAGNRLTPRLSLPLAGTLAGDPNPQVRAEVVRTLTGQVAPWKEYISQGRERRPDPVLGEATLRLLMNMVDPALPDRDFERHLILAALERHAPETGAFLSSPAARDLPVGSRRLACGVLPETARVGHLGRLLTDFPFEPSPEEWILLHRHRKDPIVARALSKFTPYPFPRILKAAVTHADCIDPERDRPWLAEAARTILRLPVAPAVANETHGVVLDAVERFRLLSLDGDLVALWRKRPIDAAIQLRLVQVLGGIQSGQIEFLGSLVADIKTLPRVREEAVQGLAHHPHPGAPGVLLPHWSTLSPEMRATLLPAMLSTPNRARALLKAIQDGHVSKDDLPAGAVDTLRERLSDPEGKGTFKEILDNPIPHRTMPPNVDE